jgi:hypothetical protein
MNRRILQICFLLAALLGFSFGAHAQFVAYTSAAQHHGGGSGATSFAYVTGSVTGCVTSTNVTTCTYALHSNPVAGQSMAVAVGFSTGSATSATFACTNNGSFTLAGSFVAGTGALAGFDTGIFYKNLTASGADTCTLTANAAASILWESAQYTFSGTFTGPDGAATYTQANSNGSDVATITASGATSGSSDLVVAADIINNSGVTFTPGTGYTFRNDTAACSWNGTTCVSTTENFNTDTGGGYEDKVNIAAGTQSATFNTNATSDPQLMGLVSFH